ncbi:MAG TPA: MaoC family dehydratase [Spirochaetota bacterium]|nr:MaoC family dehydratase [Spirochaetota bacterium]HPC43334.1 MaoC family dehydratase [Spirochaetota bacterium]HPL17508.1 MaoC family dehydratase [Spirochaetota bacterium]HQF06945.1 MaoC family dehydratase [Spirochaetota bacterium]HQH95682.1 MaoC family dehydratase [Spirochaetota bacterium]
MALTVLPLAQLKESIGEERASDWLKITQEMINSFADCTDDHNFIHVDPERARSGPFGRTIAHGFLTLSLVSRLAATGIWLPEGVKEVLNYGLNRVRFIRPVPSGSQIRSVMKLAGVEEKGNGRVLIAIHHRVFVEGSEKPALTAEWLGLCLT